jgi:hypothetical protein
MATACLFLALSKATKASLCLPMVRPLCIEARLGLSEQPSANFAYAGRTAQFGAAPIVQLPNGIPDGGPPSRACPPRETAGARMRRFLARFSEPVSSGHARSWADFTSTTSELRFSVQTRTHCLSSDPGRTAPSIWPDAVIGPSRRCRPIPFFHDFKACATRPKPLTGDRCVFCSYGSVPCRPMPPS